MTTFLTRRKSKRSLARAPRHPAALAERRIVGAPNAESVELSKAVPANLAAQLGGYGFRPLYAPMVCRCRNCAQEFAWTVAQQVYRFEVLKLHVESFPPYCPACSRTWRLRKRLLAEYDALVGAARDTGDLAVKSRVVALIAELCDSGYTPPGRMIHTEAVLQAQLASAARRGDAPVAPAAPTRNRRPLI